MAAKGLFSGLLGRVLGVGGGASFNSCPCVSIFPAFGVPEAVQMKLAVGTSLATIIPTSIQSARKHHAKGAMNVPLLRALAPSIAVGVLAGTALGIFVEGRVHTAVFAVIAAVVAAQMAFTPVDWRLRDSFPTGAPRLALGGFIGGVSAMMGIGGGTVGVPLLSMFGTPIRGAVATASAFGVIIAVPATIGFVHGGWGVAGLPPGSLGYVNLVGVALIVPSSLIAAPWGVRLAHGIPPLLLKRCFAVFLGVTVLRMLWGLFG